MIKAQNLSIQFEKPLLEKISYTVKAGTRLVILGRSGIGKTVLLKALSNLIPLNAGTVENSFQRVSMVFQQNALFNSMSVFENLDFPLRETSSLNGLERENRIHDLLKKVGLPGTEKLFPSELSGGMQKRLGIARALITQPDLLFYDEPTAGLDPVTSRKITNLILELQQSEQSTLVCVTSHLSAAFALATEIAMLMPGEKGATLLPLGPPEKAKQSTFKEVQDFFHAMDVQNAH